MVTIQLRGGEVASEERAVAYKVFDPPMYENRAFYALKPESNFDSENLTETQLAEIRRRAALDYKEYDTKDEYMAYVEDVAQRKHLSWY
jgi:hypothetical protein